MHADLDRMIRARGAAGHGLPDIRTRLDAHQPVAARCARLAMDGWRWQAWGGVALATILGLTLAASAGAQEQRHASFISAEGADIGTATLTGTIPGLLIELDLHGLPEGWHGFHIHENGECDAEGGFQSAGGHFAVSDTAHGFQSEGGPHSGDMPNQYVAADGTLKAQEHLRFRWRRQGQCDRLSPHSACRPG